MASLTYVSSVLYFIKKPIIWFTVQILQSVLNPKEQSMQSWILNQSSSKANFIDAFPQEKLREFQDLSLLTKKKEIPPLPAS